MAPKKRDVDRHKPNRMARIRTRVVPIVEALAEADEKAFTQMVNDLVIEALKARSLWPPPERK